MWLEISVRRIQIRIWTPLQMGCRLSSLHLDVSESVGVIYSLCRRNGSKHPINMTASGFYFDLPIPCTLTLSWYLRTNTYQVPLEDTASLCTALVAVFFFFFFHGLMYDFGAKATAYGNQLLLLLCWSKGNESVRSSSPRRCLDPYRGNSTWADSLHAELSAVGGALLCNIPC